MPRLSLSRTYASKEFLFPLVSPFGSQFSLSPFICPEEVIDNELVQPLIGNFVFSKTMMVPNTNHFFKYENGTSYCNWLQSKKFLGNGYTTSLDDMKHPYKFKNGRLYNAIKLDW